MSAIINGLKNLFLGLPVYFDGITCAVLVSALLVRVLQAAHYNGQTASITKCEPRHAPFFVIGVLRFRPWKCFKFKASRDLLTG